LPLYFCISGRENMFRLRQKRKVKRQKYII